MPFARIASRRNSATAAVLERLADYRATSAAVRRELPADMAGHITGAWAVDGKLVVLADSPAWATRFRFQLEPGLRKLLKQKGLKRVVVRTSQPFQERVPQLAPARLSARSAAFLASAADSTADPALQSIYRRLAARHRSG